MKEHFQKIYDDHALNYNTLVSREDYQKNLLKTLRNLCDLEDIDVVEWGAGTGRISRMLAPFARTIRAFDGSVEMLKCARKQSAELGHTNVRYEAALHHHIPLPSSCADLAIEGWSFAHLAEDLSFEAGIATVQAAIDEMNRILKPRGTMILIETLGTGRTSPDPPEDFLSNLYTFFEGSGFLRSWCRTDYRFSTVEEAVQLTDFFFGVGMLEHLDRKALILPECTGIWSKTIE